MCGNLFSSPKVEKPKVETPVQAKVEPVKVPDPTPQVINPTDTGTSEERANAENEKQRKRRGYAATRVSDDRAVLTDNATGKRATLG